MQFQSDILNVPVERPAVNETTALGAAYLAGLAVGFWENIDEVQKHWQFEAIEPKMDEENVSFIFWFKSSKSTQAFK